MVVMGVGGVAVQTRRRVTCEARLPSRMERPRGRQRPPPLRPRRRFRPAGLPGTCGRPCWRLRRRCPLSTERALNGGWRSLKPSDEWCARSSCGPWGGGERRWPQQRPLLRQPVSLRRGQRRQQQRHRPRGTLVGPRGPRRTGRPHPLGRRKQQQPLGPSPPPMAPSRALPQRRRCTAS